MKQTMRAINDLKLKQNHFQLSLNQTYLS